MKIFYFGKVDFLYSINIDILQTCSTVELVPEAYLEPSRTSTIKLFCDFHKDALS